MADERIPAMLWFGDRRAHYGTVLPKNSAVRRAYDVFSQLIVLTGDEDVLLTPDQIAVVENFVLHGMKSDADIFTLATWVRSCPSS